MIRAVHVDNLTKNIKEMCIEVNHVLSADMKEALDTSVQTEKSPLGRQILCQLQENLEIAGKDRIPICQDTGSPQICREGSSDSGKYKGQHPGSHPYVHRARRSGENHRDTQGLRQ